MIFTLVASSWDSRVPDSSTIHDLTPTKNNIRKEAAQSGQTTAFTLTHIVRKTRILYIQYPPNLSEPQLNGVFEGEN